MQEILFDYKLNPTTWAYISALMMLGTYFKFRRFWSVRNLDLVGLIAFSPALLLVYHGLSKPSSELIQAGYIWLFAVSGFFLIRLLLDPVMVRRPLLEPNLSASGLTFTGTLAMVAVLAMASVSMAGAVVTLVDNGLIAPGTPGMAQLHSWTINMNGVLAVSNVKTDAPVHQGDRFTLADDPDPEVKWAYEWSNQMPSGINAALDTHMMVALPGVMVGSITATNDKSNPGGNTQTTTRLYGMGSFDGTGMGFALQSLLTTPTAMVQVITLYGTTVHLTGIVSDGVVDTPFNVLMQDVPEPGTIMMLVAGALCLLGIRRK